MRVQEFHQKDLSGRSSHSAGDLREITCPPPGRLLAIDLGVKRVGVAVSDELHITVRPLAHIERRSWKDLLSRVSEIIESYDARALIIGLPLNLDGTKGPAATEALRIAENFGKSLNVPVFLQDERLTSLAAESDLKSRGIVTSEIKRLVDSEAAAIILRDFVAERERSTTVTPGPGSPSDGT